MGKVEQGDVVKLNAMFTALDTNSAGRVDVAMLVARAGAVARAGPARAEPALLSRANSSDAQPDSPPPCSDSSSTDHLEPGGLVGARVRVRVRIRAGLGLTLTLTTDPDH